MTRQLLLGGVLLSAGMSAAVLSLEAPISAVQEDPFPHAAHQGLFPLCTGCHEGIPSGDEADWYPEPQSCRGCHDGVERDEVVWNAPSTRVDNLVFDHVEHERERAEDGDPPGVCADCHIEPGAGRMEVVEDIQVGTCWACHAHETDDHYDVAAECETCHVPLASTQFSRARIEDLPKPASHDAETFIAQVHGELAPGRSDRCATCHTQETCASCHVDANIIEIAAIPRAPSAMDLPPREAEYPEPESHLDEGWLDAHQVQAQVRECSTCHTTDDCRTCHVSSAPDLVAALPRRVDVTAPGVMLDARSPASHESLFFMQAHSVLASADQATCQTCHVDRFCVECHDAGVGSGYHPPNFMVRHAADAYGRDSECSTCHEARVFCRACHVDTGLAGSRVAARGYHDATPLWLLQHGQAARQGLESCASCHRQVDCTRCHGVLGAFKVSPHASDFDANRAWLQSPRTCLACHIGNPTRGGR
ncbi:MAG: cytochrome c3 family protein, partial [Gemmatimonadota bacterium]|nr:cytochrome c3 family protein [Gemmatimonadota bacterium]